MNNIYWLLELSIKEGQLENFRSLMNEMVEATEKDEPDALNYEWWITDDNSTCHIYERYADSAAVMVHLGNFGSKFAERFMSCVDPSKFVIYGNVSDDVKEGLSGLAPDYVSTFFGGFGRGDGLMS